MDTGGSLKFQRLVHGPTLDSRTQIAKKHHVAGLGQIQGATAENSGNDTGLPLPGSSSPGSSLAVSVRGAQSSYLGDIRHEVMANYLYQQQCSRLWVRDGCGEIEGILLRKAHNQYLACPPALINLVLAQVCAHLGIQVLIHRRSSLQ